MSPVDPRPEVIGKMGLPSRDLAEGLRFLPNKPAASSSRGATRPPVMAPRAARKDRRFQENFRFMGVSFRTGEGLFLGGGAGDLSGAHDLDERIPRNPLHRHAGPRRRLA